MSIYDKHIEKLAAKHQVLEGKQAILAMLEEDPNCDLEYLLELRKRVRCLKVQIMAMRPGKTWSDDDETAAI